MNSISARLGRMERSDARYRRWRRCIRQVPVSLVGNRNGRFGYVYNEVDGTGSGFRTALAIDRRKPSDFRFLDFSTRRGCRSDTTKPDGTADPASVSPSLLDRPPTHRLTRPAKRPAKRLVRRLARLERRAKAVERSAKRFDRWESCLTWLPVTEYGDPEHRFGFRWLAKGRKSGFAAAVAVDRSPWDDPDYTLLTFAGNDLPGIRGCEGEGAPAGLPIGSDPTVRYSLRGRPRRDRVSDLRRDTRDLAESVEDLIEPNLEFVTFDQCMYTVGMTRRGRDGGKRGFAFRNRKGVRSTRSALAMDMSGFDAPEYNFMAFSGEEPPQIECNEDAGGLDTDE